MSMSSGRRTSVARPAQYTDSRRSTPTAARACANTRVLPTGTSSPDARRRRAKPTAARSSPGASASTTRSGTPLQRGVHELVEAVRARALLVFAVLQDGAERDVDGVLVDRDRTQRREGLGPV